EKSLAASAVPDSDCRTRHVGFHLVRNVRGPLRGILYAGSIGLVASVMTALLLFKNESSGLTTGSAVALGILTAFCGIQLGVIVVNWVLTLALEPEKLPRMDFSKGIPSESRTLVVIPTLLTDAPQINHLIEGLEVRFLANREDNVCFGLLTDFQDAASRDMPGDEALLRLIQAKVNNLNNRYGGHHKGHFFLFHRPRLWNPRQGVWMGYERKRGKLEDLNRVLRGGSPSPFSLIVGQTSVLPTIKYVITLDTDTDLPRGAARQLVGAMAHPLNRPRYDDAAGRVTEGYGILQPRV